MTNTHERHDDVPARSRRTRRLTALAATTIGLGLAAPLAVAEATPAPVPVTRLSQVRDVAGAPRRPIDRQVLPSGCRLKRYAFLSNGTFLVADLGGGDKMPDVDVVRALRAGGFTWAEMPEALATVGAESDRCPRAIHNNLTATGQVSSVDYGLWQINTRWHPQYTIDQLMDPVQASKIAKQIKDRSGWTAWHGYAARAPYTGWAAWAIAQAKDAGVK